MWILLSKEENTNILDPGVIQAFSGVIQSILLLLTFGAALWAIIENRKLAGERRAFDRDLALRQEQNTKNITQLQGIIAVRTQFMGLREKVVLDRLEAIHAQLEGTYGSLERFARSSKNLSRHDLAAGFSEALQSVCNFYSSYSVQRTGVPKRFRHHYDQFAEDLMKLIFSLKLDTQDSTSGRFSVHLSSKESLLLRKLAEHAKEFAQAHDLLYADIELAHLLEPAASSRAGVEAENGDDSSVTFSGEDLKRRDGQGGLKRLANRLRFSAYRFGRKGPESGSGPVAPADS